MSYLEGRIQRFFKAGSVIFQEGDYGAAMYIITSGQVEVSTKRFNEKVVLATLSKGAIFGEMALLDQPYRSATVVALTDVSCLEINNVFFKTSFQSQPGWMRSFFQIIVERLREADKRQDPLTVDDKIGQLIVTLEQFKDLPHLLDENRVGIKLKPALTLIQLLLNISTKQAERIIERLVEEELLKIIVDFKEGRIIKIAEPDRFSEFATYCQEQLMRKMHMEFDSAFSTLNAEQRRLVEFLSKVMREQPGVTDFEVGYLQARCQELLDCDWESLAPQIKAFCDSGILRLRRKPSGESYYEIDKSQMLGLKEQEQKLKRFADLQRELTYEWEEEK